MTDLFDSGYGRPRRRAALTRSATRWRYFRARAPSLWPVGAPAGPACKARMLPRRIGGGKRVAANALLVVLSPGDRAGRARRGRAAVRHRDRQEGQAVPARRRTRLDAAAEPGPGARQRERRFLTRRDGCRRHPRTGDPVGRSRHPASGPRRLVRLRRRGRSRGPLRHARTGTHPRSGGRQTSGSWATGPIGNSSAPGRGKRRCVGGDVLLLLTYGNDFYDLAQTRHAPRQGSSCLEYA
jgi:hypothetical protein